MVLLYCCFVVWYIVVFDCFVEWDEIDCICIMWMGGCWEVEFGWKFFFDVYLLFVVIVIVIYVGVILLIELVGLFCCYDDVMYVLFCFGILYFFWYEVGVCVFVVCVECFVVIGCVEDICC